jgi:hypothetical protein
MTQDVAIGPGARVVVKKPAQVPWIGEVALPKSRLKPNEIVVRDEHGKPHLVRREHVRPWAARSVAATLAGEGGEVVRESAARATRERPARAPEQPKEPEQKNAQFLELVRRKPCCGCGAAAPSDPHHWAPKGLSGGMARKPDDLRTVPLCRACHDHFHDHGSLPGRSRPETREVFLAAQVSLVIEWNRAITATATFQLTRAEQLEKRVRELDGRRRSRDTQPMTPPPHPE